jgi:hypothetical protein
MSVTYKSLAVAGIAALTIGLSGCSLSGIEIIDPAGVGVCNGDEPVALGVTQDSAGENFTITYDGPVGASLVAFHGMYSDEKFFDMTETRGAAFHYAADPFVDLSPWDIALSVVDPADMDVYTVVPNGTVHAEYDGSAADFIADLDYSFDDLGPNSAAYDLFLPVTIAVSCDEGITSGVITDGDEGDTDGIVNELDFAVAQAVYPGFMEMSTPSASGQNDIENGVSGFLNFPDDFTSEIDASYSSENAAVGLAYIGDDDQILTTEYPDGLVGAPIGDIWYLNIFASTMLPTTETLEFTGDDSVMGPVAFELFGAGVAPRDGYHLVTMLIADLDESLDLSSAKTVSTALHYSAETGVGFTALDPATPNEGLAATGGDPNVIIWAVLGGLVVLAAVALRPTRRTTQSESAKDSTGLSDN